uniref:Brix domain-containing protein n=1 Tax=Globisporangium ultimum (strain ATCC 200006 / CBS 805.95 / DAOM BR144) TaxID=431595 RepID=K3WK67_GLOUD
MSVRRNVRLRREYLYRKGLEGKERALYEHKQQLKEAIRSAYLSSGGKSIPTELRSQEKSLRHEMEYDDVVHEKPLNHIDDEYKNAGMFDPKIAITTSRDPSSRLKQFAQEIRLIFPNAIRLNRGAHTVGDLVESARSHDYTDLVIVTETRGEPDGLVVSHLPYGPTAYFSLSNTVLRHDIEDRATISEAYPHIILNQFETVLGKRVSNILKHLFPVPKPDSKRVITFSNDNDFISFRHHVFKKTGRDVELQECGPRFELQLYQLKLGTCDQKEAENEWVLRPYMNSAKKRRVL